MKSIDVPLKCLPQDERSFCKVGTSRRQLSAAPAKLSTKAQPENQNQNKIFDRELFATLSKKIIFFNYD